MCYKFKNMKKVQSYSVLSLHGQTVYIYYYSRRIQHRRVENLIVPTYKCIESIPTIIIKIFYHIGMISYVQN